MHQRKSKKRKFAGKNLFRVWVTVIIVLYFFSRTIPILKASGNKTYIGEYGKIEEVVSILGYIARDEKVFTSTGSGEVKYFVSEGKKIARGQKIAEIRLKNVDERLFADLEIINLRIKNLEEKQNNQLLFDKDIQKIDEQIQEVLDRIQFDLRNHHYTNITDRKNELKALLDKKSIIAGEKSFIGRNLNQLKQQKENIENKIKDSIQTIVSEYSGIVAFGSDGLEELINLQTIENITNEELRLFKNAKLNVPGKEIKKDAPVIRIIRSHRWSIICQLDDKQIEGITEGKNLKIRRKGYDREYSAKVRKIIEGDKNYIVIFDLNEFIEDYYNLRTLQVEIVKNSYEGVMIPNQAIVDLNGQLGVYIVDINGFTRFTPIKIKGQNQECSIAYFGFYEETDENGKMIRVNTIRLYDEIVFEGNSVTEGAKIQ